MTHVTHRLLTEGIFHMASDEEVDVCASIESDAEKDSTYTPKPRAKKIHKKKPGRAHPLPSPPPREARVSNSKTAERKRAYSRKRRARLKMDELRKQVYMDHLSTENTCMKTVEIPELKKQVQDLLTRVYIDADPVTLAQILYPIACDSFLDETDVLSVGNHGFETEVS